MASGETRFAPPARRTFASHGGQRRAAEHLLHHGADINTTVDYAHGTALDAVTGPDTHHDLLTTWLRENGAQPSKADS